MPSQDRPTDILTPPPLETVAYFVRTCRTLRNWKVSTLADFATVSVSTVERAEKVGEEALDKIAAALGRKRARFTFRAFR
jgi:transcriptional regulator with XRE-family HTH domain